MGRSSIASITLITLVLSLAIAAPVAAHEPEPYEEDEFPRFLRDARRFQIISLGTVPLTMLFTTLGFRLHRLATAGEDLSWGETRPASVEDRRTVLGISLSTSVIIGLVDYLLGLRERNDETEP